MKTKTLTILSLVLLLAFSGCGWFDPCRNVECGPHGTCDNGICECEAGWQDGSNGFCNEPIPCYNVDCGHGDCNIMDESCDCDMYWERSADSTCNTAKREKFLGNWTGSHTEDGTLVGPYTITISEGLRIQDILITNFLNDSCFGGPPQATAPFFSDTKFAFFTYNCANFSVSTLELTLFTPNQISLSGTITMNSSIVNISGLYAKQ